MGGQRKALIVATNEYEHVELARLASPATDAKALAEVLGDPAIGDFDVRVVPDEDAHVVQGEVEDLFSDSHPDDVLLLHFSCHGLKSESGELFFAARNTRPDRLGSTAVPADFVQRCMKGSRSRSIVVLLDCCYGGAFREGVTVKSAGDVNVLDSFPGGRLAGGRGRAVITASSAIEYAFEGARLADNHSTPSVFTGALVHGLASGEADRDEDGLISLSELYEYLYDRVREQQPNQTPSKDIEMEGELYLARSKRRRIRASPIPTDLRAAMTDANMFTRLGALSELRSRLSSPNLEVAAGAFEAVTEMAGTDIRNVADAATLILRDSAPAVSEPVLRFEPRSEPSRTVRLQGPPLARVCTHETSHDWIRVDMAGDELTISVDNTRGNARQGQVTLIGPTGNTAITVDVGTSQARPADAKPKAAPARARPRNDWKRTAAGVLAVLSGTLMILGLVPDYMSNPFDSWHKDRGLPTEPLLARAEGMYFLAIGWLAVLAGTLTLLRHTRKIAGPGLIVGAAPASVWGLVFLISEQSDGAAQLGHTWEVVTHVLLLAATVLAVLALAGDDDVRWAGRPQVLMAVLAFSSAVTLFLHRLDLYDAGLGPGATKASIVLILGALLLPLVVSGLRPVRLGMWVLVGWIAISAPVAIYYSTLFADHDRGGMWINVFLVSLAGLVVVAGYLGRSAEGRPNVPPAEVQHGELRVAGVLAVAAGIAMVAGLFPDYVNRGRNLLDSTEWVFFLVIAALTILAGTLVLVERTRRFTGPGLLIGTAAGATWDLVFLFSDLARDVDVLAGFRVELFAHLTLVLAAVLAVIALVRDSEARLTRRLGTVRLAALLAVIGALAFYIHRRVLQEVVHDLELTNAVNNAAIAVVVTTLFLPVFAAVVMPPRLATGLLTGWIVATMGVVGYSFSIFTNFGVDGDWITIYCVPLLALAIVAAHSRVPQEQV